MPYSLQHVLYIIGHACLRCASWVPQLSCRVLLSTPHSPMPPSTPSNSAPSSSGSHSQPILTTIPGPQLTTRYGPQPTSSSATSSGPVLTTIQGPQLTTRYTLPGMPSSVRSPGTPQLPRAPSQTFYHTTTPTPLSMPSGPPAAMSQLSTQSTSALALPTSANVPASVAATTTALSRGGGRKPMSLRGAFSKECMFRTTETKACHINDRSRHSTRTHVCLWR